MLSLGSTGLRSAHERCDLRSIIKKKEAQDNSCLVSRGRVHETSSACHCHPSPCPLPYPFNSISVNERIMEKI